MVSGPPGASSWRTMIVVMINFQPTPRLCGICYSIWMHISVWDPMRIIPGCSKNWTMSLWDLFQLCLNGFGNLERPQLTGIWQVFQFWKRAKKKTLVIMELSVSLFTMEEIMLELRNTWRTKQSLITDNMGLWRVGPVNWLNFPLWQGLPSSWPQEASWCYLQISVKLLILLLTVTFWTRCPAQSQTNIQCDGWAIVWWVRYKGLQ